MSTPEHAIPEHLLAQSRWVGRVARSLAADGESAADLEQETWLAALRHPPRRSEGASLRAWFATVLRHASVRHQRSESRRSSREQFVARDEQAPPAERVLELEESRGALVREVLALPEASRDAILLRFFEELSSEEIARRQGVSPSTVRGRIQRGLDQLRGRLASSHGEEWRDWCLALVPAGALAPPGAPLAAPPLTWIAMSASSKFGLTLSVALIGVVFVWSPWRATSERPERASSLAAPSEVASSAERAAASADPRPPEPAASERAALDESARASARTHVLFGALRSFDGGPVGSGQVSLVDSRGRARHSQVDERSSFSLADLAPGEWHVEADCPGFVLLREELPLAPEGGVTRHDLTLTPSWTVAIRVLEPDGQPQLSWPDQSLRIPGAYLVAVATADAPGPRLPLSTQKSHQRFGLGVYSTRSYLDDEPNRIPADATGLLEVRSTQAVHVSLVFRDLVLETRFVQPGQEVVEFALREDPLVTQLGGLRARILDMDTAEPLAGARASLTTSSTANSGELADEQGRVSFDEVLPGWMELSVSHAGHESLRERVEVPPAGVLELGELRLRRATHIRGRVLDEAGRARSLALRFTPMHLVDSAEAYDFRNHFRSNAQGEFELAQIARGRIRVQPADWSAEWAAAGVVIDTSQGPVDDALLTLERGRLVTLEFAPGTAGEQRWMISDSGGDPLASGRVRTSGLEAVRLTDGRYRLSLWSGPERIEEVPFVVGEGQERVRLAR